MTRRLCAAHALSVRPRILDEFCCEGGAGRGYWLAGFDVFGVDLFKHPKTRAGKPVLDKAGKPVMVGFSQARYPYPSVQLDALLALDLLWAGHTLRFTCGCSLGLDDFTAIHASPPCQHASAGTRAMRAAGTSEHPALIEPTRERLVATGLPYIIENVSGAALIEPVLLCGSMFGLVAEDEDGFPLRLERHRLFESNVALTAPPHAHDERVWAAGVYGGARGRKPGQTAAQHRHDARYVRHGGYVPSSIDVQQALLGVDWMTKAGMAQSIPPAYAQHIGEQILAHIGQEVAA